MNQSLQLELDKNSFKSRVMYSLWYILVAPVLALTLIAFKWPSLLYGVFGAKFYYSQALTNQVGLPGGIFCFYFLFSILIRMKLDKTKNVKLQNDIFLVAFVCLAFQVYGILSFFKVIGVDVPLR